MFDIYLLSETKSTALFQIVNFVWLDRGCLGNDMIEIALEKAYGSIPGKQLNLHKDDSETLFLEIKRRLR